MAEQLYYTWARRGPDGRSGFQVVAASAGLADRQSQVINAALGLCRYDPPRSRSGGASAPVSFGWVTVADWRLVFHRVAAPPGARGRPGNFYAHIIAGTARELPIGTVATWFTSPAWWSGQERDGDSWGHGRLPVIGVEHMTPDPLGSPGQDELAGLIECLLARGRSPLAIPLDADSVASMAAAAEATVPGILEATSFSTYESGEPTRWFDIVGIAPGSRHPSAAVLWRPYAEGPDSAARRTTRAILPGPVPNELCRAGLDTVDAGQPFASDRFIAVVESLLALERSTSMRLDDLGPLLSAPRAVAYTLDRARGLALFAEALAADRQEVWHALAHSLAVVTGEHLDRLGAEIGLRLLGAGRLARLGDRLKRSGRIAARLQYAIEEFILHTAGTAVLGELDPAGRLALLRHLSRTGQADEILDALLCDLSPTPATVLLEAADLPVTWRAPAALRLLETSPAPPVLVTALADDPALARTIAGQLRPVERLTRVVRGLASRRPAEAVELACAIAPALRPGDAAALVAELCRELPSGAAMRVLRSCARAVPARAADWDRLASSLLAEVFLDRGDDAECRILLGEEARDLLRQCTGPGCRAWQQALEAFATHSAPVGHRASEAMRPFAHTSSTKRQAAAVLTIELGLTSCATAAGVDELVTAIRAYVSLSHPVAARWLALAACRHLRSDRRSRAGYAVASYLGTLVATRRLRSRRGTLHDDAARHATETLATVLPASSRAECAADFAGSRRASLWWATILPDYYAPSPRPALHS